MVDGVFRRYLVVWFPPGPDGRPEILQQFHGAQRGAPKTQFVKVEKKSSHCKLPFLFKCRFTTDVPDLLIVDLCTFPPKKRKNLRETSGNFPTFPTSEGGNGRDLHLRWESESMPRQSWTGGVIRWLIVLLLTSETPFILQKKKANPEKDAHICFFLFFCLGCLNSMKEQFLLWNNVKGGETMILLTSSPGWSLRGDPKRPPASVAKPQTPDVTVSRDVDGRDVGRTVDASEALGSRNQWRTGGKRCKMMAKYDAKDGNSSITWFQLRHLFWLVLWRMLHWDFSLARLRLVNWDDRKKSTRDLQVKETLFAKWKKTGRNRYEFDMNHIYIYMNSYEPCMEVKKHLCQFVTFSFHSFHLHCLFESSSCLLTLFSSLFRSVSRQQFSPFTLRLDTWHMVGGNKRTQALHRSSEHLTLPSNSLRHLVLLQSCLATAWQEKCRC